MFTSGTAAILVIVVVVSARVIWIWHDLRGLPGRREAWQRGHERVSDAQFLRRLGIPGPGREATVALAVRRGVASECGVGAEFVPPDAELGEFDDVTWDGLEGSEVIEEIEKAFGTKLTTREAEHLPAPSRFDGFGQWVTAVVECASAIDAVRGGPDRSTIGK